MILLDTNICIGILHANPKVLGHVQAASEAIGIPAMVEGELYYGVEKSDFREENLVATNKLLKSLVVYHATDEIMRKFGYLKASLERQGRRIDDADVIIAATALTLDATLATGHTGHCARYDGLKIENWFS